MRTPLPAVLLATATFLAGCIDDTSSSQQRDDVDSPDDDHCKIEGSEVGRVGATVEAAAGGTVTFLDWIPKPGSPGEYVGFVLSSDASAISYLVKAGTARYHSTGTSWLHPDGDRGHAISNVDFCDPDPPCDDDGDGEVDEEEPWIP
jgi:hypothetical protein